mgnify:CR=1 FL=1
MIKSGKASINPIEWVGKTKEEFFAAVRGHLAHDKNEIWEQVQKAIQENESIRSTSESDKGNNSIGGSKASKRK